MKFTISQPALSKSIAVVSKALALNSTLPYLAAILFDVDENTVTLSTTDLTTSIRHTANAAVEETGRCVVSGKIVQQIVKNLPDKPVAFETDGSQVVIKCGKSKCRLNALNANEFPEFPKLGNEQQVELPADILKSMVGKVYKMTSKDTSRPILAGINMTIAEGRITLVATDSYRMAVVDAAVADVPDFTATINGASFNDALNLPTAGETVTIGTTMNQVVFTFDKTTYVTRKIEGNFPDYKRIIPASYETQVVVDPSDVVGALKRAAVVTGDNPSVMFGVTGNVLGIVARSKDNGESNEEIDADVNGDDVTIAFNVKYAADTFAAADGGEAYVELNGPEQPGIVRCYGNVNQLHLLMPVRM